ncbi:MAG: MarR family transcriptional regulator [Erysipelotrichales bacterium]|nr:MarR family transcriptional regulator [Erysipelotrichales bacterium]
MREFEEHWNREEEREHPFEGRRHRHGPRGCRMHGERRPHEPMNIGECEDLGMLLRITGHIMRHKAHHRFGMTQDRILRDLAEHPDRTQKDLMENLRVRPGSVSEILKKMEEKGLIERSREEEDHRMALITLTDEGRKALEGMSKEEPEEDLFVALSDEEKETMKNLLKKVLKDWESKRPRLQKPEDAE